jgi:hypothetical protein
LNATNHWLNKFIDEGIPEFASQNFPDGELICVTESSRNKEIAKRP